MNSSRLSFLSPETIAVVGASKDPTKRGYQAIRQLLVDGFPGDIYPIHPRESEIQGIRAYSTVASVPADIDLALVCTPAATVPGIMKELGDKGVKGVKGAIILAGGFSETGEAGSSLEAEITEIATEYGIRIVGPNTSGVFNLYARMNIVGMPNVQAGGLGIVSQSGNMALTIATEASMRGGLGFSTYVGVGNQADLGFNDYLAHMGQDSDTKVPVLYVEGFKKGRKFLDVAREVTKEKPVVVYKSGRTLAGQAAAKSHTGALSGSYDMTVDILDQAGLTVARQSNELIPLAEALLLLPPAKSNRIAVLADGGGHATIAADCLSEQGLKLADIEETTRKNLADILPSAASLSNPVDVAGGTDANPGVFADCAEILLSDPNVDVLLIVGLFGGYKLRFAESLGPIENETALRLGEILKRHGKPMLLQSLYTPVHPEALEILRNTGVPVHESIEMAVTCVAGLVQYGYTQKRNRSHPPIIANEQPEAARELVTACRNDNRSALLEFEALELLKIYDIPIADYMVARDQGDLNRAVVKLGSGPLAMKIVSQDILHKTEAGGVKLELSGRDALSSAYHDIIADAKAYDSNARIEGVLIAPMAKSGVELIIGVIRDPIFGPVLMFGLGGTMVEIMKDVSFRTIPLSRADAEGMLGQIKSSKILEGVRGAPPIDRAAIVELILKISNLVQAHPEISELDLNPVFAHEVGFTVVDARIILDDE